MICRVNDLYDKEVVCIKDGTKLGSVSDLVIDAETGKLDQLIIYGKQRLFGLLGREEEFIILWKEITVLGEDTILVSCEPPRVRGKRKGKSFMTFLFGS